MEKDFQRDLLNSFSLFEGLAYKLPDIIGGDPFRGKKWKFGGKKPFDLFWVTKSLPGTFFAIELKQCKKQSWNICKDTDSCSLKEHQLECLQVMHECGHQALVIINFFIKNTVAFKKKWQERKPQWKKLANVDLAFAVPIAHLVEERDKGETQLQLDWFFGKGYELTHYRSEGKKLWSVEDLIGRVILEKMNDKLNENLQSIAITAIARKN